MRRHKNEDIAWHCHWLHVKWVFASTKESHDTTAQNGSTYNLPQHTDHTSYTSTCTWTRKLLKHTLLVCKTDEDLAYHAASFSGIRGALESVAEQEALSASKLASTDDLKDMYSSPNCLRSCCDDRGKQHKKTWLVEKKQNIQYILGLQCCELFFFQNSSPPRLARPDNLWRSEGWKNKSFIQVDNCLHI